MYSSFQLSLQQTLSDPHNIESQSIAPSICQFMYSAILISLYTLFKYAWVIKQFLLESGKKSIKKKEPKAKWTHWVLSGWIINCQLYFARSPPPLKLLQNDLANSQGIHVSILNNSYSSCKMIQLLHHEIKVLKMQLWLQLRVVLTIIYSGSPSPRLLQSSKFC